MKNYIGKKLKAWDAARRKLKIKFAEMGITRCELCGSDYGLSFGHSKKRRHIIGDEINEVVLICISPCHERLEKLPEAEMTAKVKEIIANREYQFSTAA